MRMMLLWTKRSLPAMAILVLVAVTPAGLSSASFFEDPEASGNAVTASDVGCPHEALVQLGDLPAADPQELPVEACPGLRPGARLSMGCTMNFLFQDDSDYYLGTAGHCTGFLGQRMSAPTIGTFGTVVYRLNNGVGHDFALIRVDEDKHNLLEPTLCSWTGPRDAEPLTHPGQVVHMYGWGVATNDQTATRSRSGTLLSAGSQSIHYLGFASGGDSGSPATNALGSALGINTHVLLTAQGSPVVYGTHIDQALSLSHNAGFDVDVVAGDWIIPDPSQ